MGTDNLKVLECKSLRKCGCCPRECSAWHPAKIGAGDFCRRAKAAEKRRRGAR